MSKTLNFRKKDASNATRLLILFHIQVIKNIHYSNANKRSQFASGAYHTRTLTPTLKLKSSVH